MESQSQANAREAFQVMCCAVLAVWILIKILAYCGVL